MVAIEPFPESARPLTVLIVEDNPDAADSLAEFLRLAGHTVHVAYEPDTALALAVTDPPDVLVTDIGLPRLNGFDLATRIRTSVRRMLLIAVTGLGSEKVCELARITGFDHYFVKPVPPEELVRILADYSEQAVTADAGSAPMQTPSEGTKTEEPFRDA
jgi:DNA-binding response OmpR family regulator